MRTGQFLPSFQHINHIAHFPIGAWTTAGVKLAAADLATDQLAIWDAVILAAGAEAGCRLLLSEDLQEGFTWKGITVTNPFSTHRHELLEALLGAKPEP